MPGERLTGLLVRGLEQQGQHVAGVLSRLLELGHGVVDGRPDGVPGGVETAVEGEGQAFHPVGQHDAGADAVHDHGQVVAQSTERRFVQAAGEDGLGEHVEGQFDHGLADVQLMTWYPGVDGGVGLGTHDVDVTGDLRAAERRLELASSAHVVLARRSDDGITEQLAHLLEEAAFVEAGAEVDQHGADERGILDDQSAGAGLERDLDQRAVVGSQ